MKKAINETIKQVLHERLMEAYYKQNYKSKDDIFDLNKIPMEVLDGAYTRYHPYTLNISHENPLSRINRLTESTDYLAQIEDVKRTIRATFPIPDELFVIKEGYHNLFAAVLVALTDDNVDIIENSMWKLGFFRSQPTDSQLLIDRKNREWIDLRFEPILPDDVTDEIRNKYNYVYHLTPSIFAERVKQKGLTISNGNSTFKYSESRAYVTEGNITDEEIQTLADTLYEQARNANIPNLSNIYTLFEIDLAKVDKDVRFFYDINEKKGLYTKQPINADAITELRQVEAKKVGDKLPWKGK
jgi:hypothetical protein